MMSCSDGNPINAAHRKRIITAARKEQNRIAQQLYRHRQRERFRSRESHQQPPKQHQLRPREPQSILSEVKEIPGNHVVVATKDAQNNNVLIPSSTESCAVDPACFNPGGGLSYDELMAVPMATSCFSQTDWNSIADGLVYDGPLLLQGPGIVDEAGSASKFPDSTSLELAWPSPEVMFNSDWSVAEEDFLGGRPLSAPPQNNNYSIQDTSSTPIDSIGMQHDLPAFTQTQEGFQDVLSATIKFIRQHSLPASFRLNSLLLPDPYKNVLQCPQTSTLMACFQNARCIGMEVHDLVNHRSPFYRPGITMADDVQTLLTVARKPWIPLNLQPTLPQILIPHHPYLDLLPFPGLRSRAITLAATMPQLFDPIELKLDMFKDGLFCLRQGNWNIPPWDTRSWQIAPWFLTKWKLLLD